MKQPVLTSFGEILNVRLFISLLSVVIIILSVLHLTAVYQGAESWQLERTFHMGREGNIPTWFSSILLVFIALASFSCVRLALSKGERFIWFCFSIVFLVMSCDEVAMLHENIGSAIGKRAYTAAFLENFKATIWPLVLAPAVLLLVLFFALAFRKFLCRSRTSSWIFAAGAVFLLGGGIGIELTENILVEKSLVFLRPYGTFLEEVLEMSGSVFILAGLF